MYRCIHAVIMCNSRLFVVKTSYILLTTFLSCEITMATSSPSFHFNHFKCSFLYICHVVIWQCYCKVVLFILGYWIKRSTTHYSCLSDNSLEHYESRRILRCSWNSSPEKQVKEKLNTAYWIQFRVGGEKSIQSPRKSPNIQRKV